jgi:DNA-binding IclR family transcriptional regulator
MASNSPAERSQNSLESPTNSLDRAIEILELLLGHPKGLTHAELCRSLGLPSSTCSYITGRLERRGYLRRESESRRFCLGLKSVSLARGALLGLGFRSISEPVLYRLSAETGLSVGIGVAHGAHVLLVDHLDGPDVIDEVVTGRKSRVLTRENREIGRELPYFTTALGKVLLAHMAEDQRGRLIERRPNLRLKLQAVRENGFAVADKEHYANLRALAVPIRDAAGLTRAALSLNGRPDSAVWNDQSSLVSSMQAAAHEISRSFC